MNGVSKITVTEEVSLVTFSNIPNDSGIMAAILNRCAEEEINIDMISHSASQREVTDISFTISANDLIKVLKICKAFREDNPQINPMVSTSNYKIQLYGEEMCKMHGVAAKAIDTIAKSGTQIMMITTSEVDISVLVPSGSFFQCIDALQNAFSIPEYKFVTENETK